LSGRFPLTRPQLALVAHALLLIALMFAAVPALTRTLGPPTGYLAALALYWVSFCVPVYLWHVRGNNDGRLFSERLAWRDWWIPPLLLLQVVAIAAFGVAPHTSILTTDAVYFAGFIALLNGPLEEIAWRAGFIARFRDRPRLGFWLNWVLFTAWHIPLATAEGIVYDGGTLALVGGAGALGLLWSAIAFRTGSVFWVGMAHALTNALTFSVLFSANGFA